MDREYMQEVINGMRKIVKPYLAKQLKKINFEGCGNTDKAEFETDFEIVLTLAEQALAIPSAEPYKGMTNFEVIRMLFPNPDKIDGEFRFTKEWGDSLYSERSK